MNIYFIKIIYYTFHFKIYSKVREFIHDKTAIFSGIPLSFSISPIFCMSAENRWMHLQNMMQGGKRIYL